MSTIAVHYCVVCDEERSFRHEQQSVEFEVRGETLAFDVPVKVCDACGVIEDEVDPAEIAFQMYREKGGLLTPQQIREIRERYKLSQKSLAALLGMSEATINRYEGGGIQDEAHDTAIRSCANPDIMREHLQRRGNRLSDFQRRRVEESLNGEEQKHCGTLLSVDKLWSMPDELSLKTGFRRFNYERYAAIVAWFCERMKMVTTTSLNKLLFYADFLHFDSESVSLTGAVYRKLPYGPVPADFGGLREQMELDQFVEVREVPYQNGRIGEEYRLGPMADEVKVSFSSRELKTLEKVADEFGNVTPSEISDRSHRETAWQDTEDLDLISYDKAASLSFHLP